MEQSLEKFKNEWIKRTLELKEKALMFLDSERKNASLMSDILAIEEVRQLILSQNYTFDGLTTVEELTSAFPTILLPAPNFISLCRKYYERNRDVS